MQVSNIPGRVNYRYADVHPTSQYDPCLVGFGDAGLSCTAIACVAALQTCGANAVENMSNLTASARETWATSIKCGAHVHQDMESTGNLATGVQETLPVVRRHLGLAERELGADSTFEFHLTLNPSVAEEFHQIAFNSHERDRMDFLGMNDGSPPLKYIGRDGLGDFLKLCLATVGYNAGASKGVDNRLVRSY